MIITVCMKNPDAMDFAIRDAVMSSFGGNETIALHKKKEREAEVREFLNQWFECEEYLTIDFDSDFGTATVRKQKS